MPLLDMPVGNDDNPAYNELMKNVEAGRHVVVIPLADNKTYVVGGTYETETDNLDVHHWRLIKLAHQGVLAAEAEGEHVLHG